MSKRLNSAQNNYEFSEYLLKSNAFMKQLLVRSLYEFLYQILLYRSLKRVTLSLFLLSLNVEVLSFIVGCMSHTCCGNHVIEDE